jgi:radical SAM superfamily enzyme YgiQ (UPF0313 family)
MNDTILFIHPGNHRKTYQELAGEFTAIAPPVWATFLAEHVRRRGIETAIHDTNVSGWNPGILETLYGSGVPRLTVVMVYGHNPSASTQTMVPALAIIRDIKALDPGIQVAIGGLHPNALPEQSLRESGADFLIRGEGGPAIVGLYEALRKGRSPDSVPGLAWLDADGRLAASAPVLPSANLDADYPANAWDLLPPLALYRAHNSHTFQFFRYSKKSDFSDVRSPYAVLYTSLGCPFNCSYCCINSLFDRPRIRYWSLDTVFGWLDRLAALGVRNVRLDDELFVLDPKRVEAFCDHVVASGHRFNFWAYARVDTIPEPRLLDKMKQAGFDWLCLGIESGNSAVRLGVSKNIHRDIGTIVRQIQSHGIYILGNYMFGLPDDTLETMQETLDLSIRLNCEFSNYYSTMAYPGSALHAQIAATHPEWLPPTLNGWSQHSYECQPLPTKHLTAAQVLRFRDDAFDAFFKNETYLSMVRGKFGDACVDHIRRMTAIRLRRKLYPS